MPSSQLIECDPPSANLSGQTQTPMISRSFAATLMVGLSREHSLPSESLVSPGSGPSGPLQGSGTLVNPCCVRVFCLGLATTCLCRKVRAARGVPSSQLIECDPASANLSGQTQTPMISGSFAAALMVASREHNFPSLARVSSPHGFFKVASR